jgi:outer membrane murein-binding lipoprotein Lpp
MGTPDEPVIEIRVADWLTRIEEKTDKGFAEIKGLLSGKMDKADGVRLSTQIESIDKRTTALERDRDARAADEQAHSKMRAAQLEWKRWALPTSLSAAYILVVLFTSHVL